MAYIEFRDVVKEYHTEGASIKALNGANFQVEKGELAVIQMCIRDRCNI